MSLNSFPGFRPFHRLTPNPNKILSLDAILPSFQKAPDPALTARNQKQLPHWQSVRNKLIGRIRGAIERTFCVLDGFVRMRWGCDRCANAFHLETTGIAFNLRTIAAKSR